MSEKCVPVKKCVPGKRSPLARANTPRVWMLTHCVDYEGIITGPWLFTERWAAREFGDAWLKHLDFKPVKWKDHLEYNTYYLTYAESKYVRDEYLQLERLPLDECWNDYADRCGPL